MADDSPEAAVDAYLDRIRATLRCMTHATAFASPFIPGQSLSVTLRAAGQNEPGRIRLPTHDGQGELIFRFAHEFTVDPSERDQGGPFEVRSSFYQYRILDYAEHEIIIYDWHPYGISPVTSPHLHVSAACSVVLQQRSGSQLANRKTYIGSFHLPTSTIFLEDIVELLIREFRVDPLRRNWQRILRENRDAITRSEAK